MMIDDILACLSQRQSSDMQTTYHPDIYQSGKWQCCGKGNKNDQGCQDTGTALVNAENYNKPLPQIPSEYLILMLLLTHVKCYANAACSSHSDTRSVQKVRRLKS